MKDNKIKLITEILAIVVIVLVSFVGVYKQKYNMMENQVKGYKYSKDLDGYREIILEVSSKEENSEEKAEEENSDAQEENNDSENNEEKTENDNKYEDYENSKRIFKKRLQLLGIQDYTISQNNENGTVYIQIPENEDTDYIVSNLLQIGNFEVKDSEDGSKTFLANDDLKKVIFSYNKFSNENAGRLQFKFDKEGKKILKDISSNEYKTKDESSTSQNENPDESSEEKNEDQENTTNSTDTEETESKTEEKTQKKVALSLDGSNLISTSFENTIENGVIDLTMNIQNADALKSASAICSILNSGKLPLTYEIKQNAYVQTDIRKEDISKVYTAIGVMFAVALIYLIIKFKERGVIASIAHIGFLALDLLIVRYTNVLISIESIVVAVIVLAINYLVVYELLKMDKNTKTMDLLKSQILKAIPIVLIGVIFTFTKFTKLSTCGMFIFWGLTLSFIYNYILTNSMIKQIGKGANIDEE